MANPLLVSYLIFFYVHIHSVTANFLKTRRILLFANIWSFCWVLHVGLWWWHISSVDKLTIFWGLVFKVVSTVCVHLVRWFVVHHPAWGRVPSWLCLSPTFSWERRLINKRIFLELNSGKPGMINPFIEHLVIVSNLLKSWVVSLDVSWLFEWRFFLSLLHFFLGYLRARQFKITVFVFSQKVFNLGICGKETGLFHSSNFEGLARLSTSNVRGS